MLKERGFQVLDHGTDSEAPADYPEYAHAVASDVTDHSADLGLLVCGNGLGMSMVANRHMGVRAARCLTTEDARSSRTHNNANILCLGGRITDAEEAKAILSTFIESQFEGGRHARRVSQFDL